jgi:signal transduction histidine kinase
MSLTSRDILATAQDVSRTQSWPDLRLAKARAFSPATFTLAFLPLTLGSVLIDGLPKGADPPLAWYSSIAAFAVAAGFFLGAGAFVEKFLPEAGQRRTIAVLAIFAATEIVRTLTVAFMLWRYDIVFDPMLHHRILSGGLTGILILGLVSTVVNDHAEYRRKVRVFFERQEELTRELHNLNENIDSFIDTLRESVNQTVDAALAPLADRFQVKKSVTDVVNDIIRLSESVVRPLSHHISDALPEAPVLAGKTPRVSLRRLIPLIMATRPFNPRGISLVVLMLLLGASIFTIPLPDGVIILAASVGSAAFFHYIGLRFVVPRLTAWGGFVRFVVISTLYTLGLVLVLVGYVLVVAGDFTGEIVVSIVYLSVIVQFVSWALALPPALRAGQAEILDELVHTTSELGQVRSRAEVRLRREKQQLAAIVHGDIQSTLMAAALKLQQPELVPGDVTRIIDTTRDTITASIRQLRSDSTPRMFKSLRTDLQAAWDGLVVIDWDVHTGVQKVVNSDPDLAETLWQVCREAVANAVKHGRASTVAIRMAIVSQPELLRVEVADNGHAATSTSYAGGGSRLFQAVSEHCEIVTVDGRTTLALDIPLQRSTQAAPVA